MQSRPRVALYQLRSDCATPLQHITRKLLSLESTQRTLAQVIDGLPTKDNYFGPRDSICYKQHPDIASRVSPSDEAYALASKFCSSLDLEQLIITATVCSFR
jgi:hypothetical protein